MPEPAAAPRGGRPRSEQRDQEILDAALQAFVADGYDAMTIEGIASRIGASKATVYRRWRNKDELVVEAVRRHAVASVALVDTGDVREDVRAYLRGMLKAFRGFDGALMIAFTAERIRHPELGKLFDERFVTGRRAHLRRLVQAAVDRGDLPGDADVELLADVGPAILLQHLAFRPGPLRPDLADRIVDQFFPPHPS
jgi:AcrR family transcriptional regulator